MQTGTKVRAKVLIQSDDRANGIDDGSVQVPIGTKGIVAGPSEIFVEKGSALKKSSEPLYKVQFDNGVSYDVVSSEIEVVADFGADIVCIVTTCCDGQGCPSDNLLFIGNSNETAIVQAERAFVAIGLKYDVEVTTDHLDDGYFEIDGGGCVCISWPRIPCRDGDNDDLIIS